MPAPELCPLDGKICYPFAQLARQAAICQGRQLRIYKCPRCCTFHLTSAPYQAPPRQKDRR